MKSGDLLMERENRDIIDNIIALVTERNKEPSLLYKNPEAKMHSLFDGTENPEWEKLQNNLVDYMSTLSDENVIMLETMMFIGREGDEGSKKTGDELYKSAEDYVKSLYKEKAEAIEYITSKGPLNEYLCKALRIMK